MTVRILQGDVFARLAELPDESVHCVVTSPPYWGLRSYGDLAGEIGREPTLDEHIDVLVRVFREVRRVLRSDGNCWINYGDAYAHDDKWGGESGGKQSYLDDANRMRVGREKRRTGLKPKDLIMLPARLALALQADGWWVRSEVVWWKTNAMPESATDRPTCAHEKIFLLTKSGRPLYWTHPDGRGRRTKPAPDYRYRNIETGEVVHRGPGGLDVSPTGIYGARWRRFNLWRGHDCFYDAYAVRTLAKPWHGTEFRPRAPERKERDTTGRYGRQQPVPSGWDTGPGAHGTIHQNGRTPRADKQRGHSRAHAGFNARWDHLSKAEQQAKGANLRNVWPVASQPFRDSHYATFPPALVETCLKAGTSEKGACAACGAPWTRLTDTEYIPQPDVSLERGKRAAAGLDPSSGWAGTQRMSGLHTHTGWAPSCDCEEASVIPCVVLDPFGGAGTTGLVADRLGRDAILIELNPEYVEMARARITNDAPLFSPVQSPQEGEETTLWVRRTE